MPLRNIKKQAPKEASPASETAVEHEKNNSKDAQVPQTLRGMRDVLPEESGIWRTVSHAIEKVADDFRFERIITPVMEHTSLFQRSVGEGTDVVQKEMYTFLDKNNESVSLRPEFTSSIARAYHEHGMHNRPQPVRLWDVGPVFRHDRPQAGRYRQFWQVNYEIMGDAHPVVDAVLMQAAVALFADLKIPVAVAVNSIGDRACRQEFVAALTHYLKGIAESLCDDCRQRSEVNPLRTLDCKLPACQAALADAPQIVDWLCNDCRQHFIHVLEYLDELELPYYMEPKLVRGLDYYTRTTFELFSTLPDVAVTHEAGEEAGDPRPALALGGGGRYDMLVSDWGGRPTPSIGFACGIERMVNIMHAQGLTGVVREYPPQVFIAQLGNEARKACMKLFGILCAVGYQVAENFSKDGLSAQLEFAHRLKCRYTLILGQKELMDKTIIIRDMESGIQEIVDFNKVTAELSKRLHSAHTVAALPVTAIADHAPANEPKKIDLRREEYLINQSIIQEEEKDGDGEPVVVIEQSTEEVWVEEELETDTAVEEKQGGLKWVSEDYQDEEESGRM